MQKAHFNCRQGRRTLLVVGMALGLAACASSNDGLSSVEEADLQQRLRTAESEKARAEADAEMAEAEKAAAEAEKAAAEVERMMAEAARARAEAEKATAEAARARAEAEKATAEAARATAEAARARAEAEADSAEQQRQEAERQRLAAEAARAAAEAERATAEAARATAEAARARAEAALARAEAALARAEAEAERADASAEQQRQEAERQRLAAEAAERQRMILEEEAAEARREALQTEARIALMGLKGTPRGDEPDVTPKYSSPASISVSGTTFTNPRGSSARPWYITTANNRGSLNEDTVVVYSDVKAPDSVPIMEQHRDFSPLDDNDNILQIRISDPDRYSRLIKSSRFPTGGGRTSTIPLAIDSDDDDVDDLTARLPGSFDGASGHFQCSGGVGECTVHYTGAQYNLGGGGVWTFQTSKNSKVKVPDSNFMYFGWWSRESIEDGTLSYSVFSDRGLVAASGEEFNALEGTATYTGPAIGQYAIYQTLGTQSNHGAFKATARFTADFSRNVLSGSITGFDTSPDWSLTLMEKGMGSGTVTGGDVSWTIKGDTEQSGSWDGAFQSEVNPYAGHFPDGLTGTFDAEFGDVGKIQGAYGTHINP